MHASALHSHIFYDGEKKEKKKFVSSAVLVFGVHLNFVCVLRYYTARAVLTCTNCATTSTHDSEETDTKKKRMAAAAHTHRNKINGENKHGKI